MKSIAIYHHLGLGDMIECSSIVREYYKQYNKVYLFCKSKYIDMVKTLYIDLKNLYLIPVSDDPTFERNDVNNFFISNPEIQRFVLGHENYFSKITYYNNLNFSCSEAFYDLAKLPYSIKYKNFHLERNLLEEERIFNKLNSSNEKYIFIHDDSKRGFNLNIETKYKIIKNDVTENIFYMVKILEKAEEIHCMSSSFLCLIDCLSEKADFKNLFLHYGIRNVAVSSNSISKKWKIIK